MGFGGVGTKPCTFGEAARYSSHAMAGAQATSTRPSESNRPISVPSRGHAHELGVRGG